MITSAIRIPFHVAIMIAIILFEQRHSFDYMDFN